MASQRGQTFIGRLREMSALTSALDRTLDGHGQMVMLAGEPGIGKTSTAREFAAYAGTKGAQVLCGWCYEGDGAPPYWPWTHAIGSYVEGLDAGQLAALLDGGSPRLAEIVPQIRQKLPDLPTPPELEPDQARFQLFDSVATFLKNASTAGPLLVVLEGLRRADHASLMLLEFVISGVSATSLMALGTYREVEVGRRHHFFLTLAELARDPDFQRFHLNSFSREDVARFVESRGAITLNDSDLELVHGRTGGNPFFLNEYMRLNE